MHATHQYLIAESKTPMEDQETDAVRERDLTNIFAFATKNTEDLLHIYSMIVSVQDHKKNFAIYILL